MQVSESPQPESTEIREATRRALLQNFRPSRHTSNSSRSSSENRLSLPPPSPFDCNFAGLEVCQDEFQGLQVHTAESDNKQVHDTAEGKVLRCSDNDEKEIYDADAFEKEVFRPKEKRFYAFPKRIGLAILATFLITVIGLTVGLGVGLGIGHSHKSIQPAGNSTFSQYKIGGAINPSYFSTKGAFNGSGIATASDWSNLQGNTLNFWYQHFTGEIRWMNFNVLNGSWTPRMNGTTPYIVAADAKNSTPIAAVAFAENNTGTTHLFYIDTDNYVRQLTFTNITEEWHPGPFNEMNVKALDADLVGLQVCFFDDIYPNSAYYNNNSDAIVRADYGMNLWVAVDNVTFQQYLYVDSEGQWTERMSWNNYNGHSGLGCYTWAKGNTSYVMLENLDNSIEVWWMDTTPDIPSLPNHPINVWQNATNAMISNIYTSSSIGYTNYLFAQSEDYVFRGYNISFQAENSTLASSLQTSSGAADLPNQQPLGVPGSHMLNTAVPNSYGGNSVLLWYQAEGDDITMASGDLIPGPSISTWNFTRLPIPDA